MRVRLLIVAAVVVLLGAAAGVVTLVRSGNDDTRLPPPATASAELLAFMRQATPLPHASDYLNSTDPSGLGPMVRQLNQAWAGYFGATLGQEVIAADGWGSAGVGLLEKGDPIYPMCGSEVMFDANGDTIIYCREVRVTDPGGSNPHSGNILVPNTPYITALQDVGDNWQQGQLNSALVTAFFYASHIQAELNAHGLAAWQDGTAAQMCVAGVGLATLVPSEPSARQWILALDFLFRFWHFQRLPVQLTELRLGFQSANPQKCFAQV